MLRKKVTMDPDFLIDIVAIQNGFVFENHAPWSGAAKVW